MTGIVTAPWTPGQVASLNGYQSAGVFHEFTCGRDWCRTTDRSPLTATPDGWTHPCGYTQDWAHAFMADWSWRPGASAMDAEQFMGTGRQQEPRQTRTWITAGEGSPDTPE